MEELLNLSLGQIAGSGISILLLLSLFIEIVPVKISPLGWIGSRLNQGVLQRVGALEKQVAEQTAISARARILRFGEELLRGVEHTKEHFDSILKDIKMYEAYCEKHREFENGITEPIIERIKEVYRDRLRKNDFLK